DSCPTSYQTALSTVTGLGVLVVASAGNASGSVETPANCSASVSGMIAVAGLRNVGTKVGYSSFGPEVGVAAPAGNCINTTGACLRSIDTTTNLGTTVPGANGYTNQTNTNLGTSFSAPIVSGIAGLMRSVNGNLTPALLVKRLESSATAFPANTSNLPVCPSVDSSSDECSCPASGECGTGMVNALSAVNAALQPIAAVSFPSSYTANSQVTFNASGSTAACGRSIASYLWSAGSGVTITSGTTSAQVVASGTGTLTLTITDSQGATDVATITLGTTSATSTAPTSLGTTACPTSISATPKAPTVTQAFSPTTVGVTVASTMTLTLGNTNAFALTQSSLNVSLPSGLTVATSPAASTTCSAVAESLSASGSTVSLANAIIPANGSCSITLSVSSTTAGTYTSAIAAGALSTGPAGTNSAAQSATLTVTAPIAPTISQSFSPSSVGEKAQATLTITLSNTNAYALTQAALTDTLPSNLTIATSPAAATSCAGSVSATSGVVTLTGASIPANGSCAITIAVSSGSSGTYTNTIAAGALTDAQSATNTASSGTLTVTAPKSGGGSLAWLDLLIVAGALAARLLGKTPRKGLRSTTRMGAQVSFPRSEELDAELKYEQT
ncbi:MAG TPA: S8 family serine peptidase, partial [Steroidobacteraceae bacterium]|nr:S8 family serine peptidase [Steroidobacteraceae bacterium]